MKGTVSSGLSDLEKTVIRELTGDLPPVAQPFQAIARDLGISQRRLLSIIRKLQKEGLIRRFGATLRHRKSGFKANAMAVWLIPEQEIDRVGTLMASFREVTHCYWRRPQKDWKFNLYTMIHGATEEACRQTAERISERIGGADYRLLFSRRELKKTTMRYFHE